MKLSIQTFKAENKFSFLACIFFDLPNVFFTGERANIAVRSRRHGSAVCADSGQGDGQNESGL